MKIFIENNKDIKEITDHIIDGFLRGWTIKKRKIIWNEKMVIPEIINNHKLQWIDASVDWGDEILPNRLSATRTLEIEYIYFNPNKFSLKRIDDETILIVKEKVKQWK